MNNHSMVTDFLRARKGNENDVHWYEDVPHEVREAFAKKYCRSTWLLGGQTCVIVSYPRDEDFKVRVYDMDGCEMRWVNLLCTSPTLAFDALKKGRSVEIADYEWSMINESILVDEAHDICDHLFEQR